MRKKVSYSLPKAPYCFETYVEGPNPVFKYHYHCHRFHSYYCQHYHQYHHITISTTVIITSITIVCILG